MSKEKRKQLGLLVVVDGGKRRKEDVHRDRRRQLMATSRQTPGKSQLEESAGPHSCPIL